MDEQEHVIRHSMSEFEEHLGMQDREIVQLVGKLSLVSGQQIRRVCFVGSGNSRTDEQRARRALLSLTRLGVLARLERRVGGARSGSEGFCYRLAPAGRRLMRRWAGDSEAGRSWSLPEPGERFVRHRLAVSDVYVRLVEMTRQKEAADIEVIAFEAEPACWRAFIGYGGVRSMLKPDAFVRLGVGAHERWWFVEVDLGTVSRRTRESQAGAYRTYWRSGAYGDVMPRVLWLTPNELIRERALAAIRPSGEPGGLFVIPDVEGALIAATQPVQEAAA
jgi:protein involved in plasmid replication-relaxation